MELCAPTPAVFPSPWGLSGKGHACARRDCPVSVSPRARSKNEGWSFGHSGSAFPCWARLGSGLYLTASELPLGRETSLRATPRAARMHRGRLAGWPEHSELEILFPNSQERVRPLPRILRACPFQQGQPGSLKGPQPTPHPRLTTQGISHLELRCPGHVGL